VEEAVLRYYAGRVKEEWKRQFADPYSRLEHDTTMFFINRYLRHKKNLLILDAGGGPGRYTIDLAHQQHRLVLLDPVVENLLFAKKKIRAARVQRRVEKIVRGSIEDLSSFQNNTFDVVVCLSGPLSHILRERQRFKASTELVRVLKPGGLLFVSVIGRISCLVLEMKNGFKFTGNRFSISRKLRDKGDFDGKSVFTAFHGFTPSEFRKLFERGGRVEILEMVGLEGIGATHAEEINRLAKRRAHWKLWKETHLKTCTEPSAIGISEHLLLIAKKA
jgi:ubiquinone/menaquinone biosynthesis C-methylase UbiE